MVLVYHLSLAAAAYRVFMVGPLLSAMKAGVTIFFVISGFLLYLPYARAISGHGVWPKLGRYARRRAVRILPAYWVALSVIALAPFANDVFSANWWRYFSLTQIYHPSTMLGGLSVAWTLCVEVTFYALLPALASGVSKIARRWPAHPASLQLLAIGSLALISIGVRGLTTHSLIDPVSPHGGAALVLSTSLPGLFDWFAIGLALAVFASEWEVGSPRFRVVRAAVHRPGTCWVAAGIVYFASVVVSPLDLFLPEVGVLPHLLLGAAAMLFVLPALEPAPAGARALPVRLLTTPVAVWLGTISYGIYLWNTWLLTAIAGPLALAALHPQGAATILGVVFAAAFGTIALAAASWYLVERPTQRRLNRPRERGRLQLGIDVRPAQRSSAT
jgi:peptidoglycan/LPS O-acetylase OafA/YrhL